jgi:hypothetical protein
LGSTGSIDRRPKWERCYSRLTAEWVQVKNTGTMAKALTGWTLRDTSGHVFKFPTFRLKPARA